LELRGCIVTIDAMGCQREIAEKIRERGRQRSWPGRGARLRRGIENSLHWVLDVIFREDDSRLRTGYGAENFALIRHLALNLLKREPSKGSLKRKRYKATLSNEFRSNVLFPQ
jgi:predicted transposase YbfD/YdcC